MATLTFLRRIRWRRVAAYAWAAPTTLVGLLAGLLVLLGGGRVRVVRGVAEFSGGRLARWVGQQPARVRFAAMTLGHAIVGLSERDLATLRAHEHVHVRQCERWGPFFLPAYLLAGAWQALHGRQAWRDNPFEREAIAHDEAGRRAEREMGAG